jgi:type I restriction enzyme, S subunit
MAGGVALAERMEELPKANGPWPLPQGWCWTTLGEILNPISKIDPKGVLGHRNFHHINLSALENGRITKAQLVPGNEAPSRARQVVQPGDTLFSCVRVYLQNIALLGEGLSSPVASTAYCVMRPSAVVDPYYLNYFVRSRRFIEWMIPLQRGNSPPAVLDGDLKAQAFPLAPLAEQRRIVGRIDALLAEIAEGAEALAAARDGLDTFRRAQLKAAVTGELTKDWRAANPTSETGRDILTRLRKRYPNASPTRAGWKPKGDLPPLPEGWTWCAIEEAGEVQLGRQRAPQHHEGDNMRPYLRVANVLEDRLDLSDVKWMNFTPTEFRTAW